MSAKSQASHSNPHVFPITNAYHLVARHSGKCLEVSYGSSQNGVSIHQEPCGDGHTQQAQAFVLVPSPYNGSDYELVNRKSGKCMDVKDASTSDGAGIQQYDCLGWGQTNQVFQGLPVSASDTEHDTFRPENSHKCLDVAGVSTADGALLQQWTCGSGLNQQFGYEPVEANPVPTNTYVTLDETLYGHPGYQTLHGSVEAPQSVAGQKVYVNFKKRDGSGTYVYTSQYDATLNGAAQYTINYAGLSSGDWEAIAIYPGAASLAESKSPEGAHRFHVGDGYRFRFRNSGKCLSTSAGGTGNGTALIQWDCSPAPSAGDGQVYSVKPVDGIGEYHFQIRPDSATGQCVDVTGGVGSTNNGASLQLWNCFDPPAANQVWRNIELSSPNQGWFAWIGKDFQQVHGRRRSEHQQRRQDSDLGLLVGRKPAVAMGRRSADDPDAALLDGTRFG